MNQSEEEKIIKNQEEGNTKEENKDKLKNNFKKITLNLEDLLKLDDVSKYELIEKTLKESVYETENSINNKDVFKIVSLILDKSEEDEVILPCDVRVKKNDKNLIFYVKKKKGFLWLFILLGILILATIGVAYSAIKNRIIISNLNIDLDGDGIVDINIDFNSDFIPDINVDTDKDNKPNVNIDYKGNRKAMFNIDIDGDGIPDYNLVTYPIEDPKACTINCDLDGDGWPDINFDIDGDGIPDLDIDVDKDGKPDINLDIDGDTYCDAMCDEDGDGICDKYCVKIDDNEIKTGPSTKTDGADYEPNGLLQINFLQGNSVIVNNLFPDDQIDDANKYGGTVEISNKVIKVENVSNYAVMYNLELVVNSNTFKSNNLKYKITSTNGGGSFDWQTVPFNSTILFEKIFVPARATQTYTISFKLQGINANQNYDQGREFIGYFDIKTI